MRQLSNIYVIKVECHSGYKVNERPISFTLEGKKLMVEKIVDRWRDPQFNYFKVLTDDGKAYLLRYDERNDEWKLEKVYEY
ncbi:MAG TPA: hypothetical protein EYP21_07840 [Syntrophaceae bacterium]|nr:hypothetical protein [Syntrophaceae bacterium]